MSEACWSPTRAVRGGLPGRAVASPSDPDESTTVGRAAGGEAEAVDGLLAPTLAVHAVQAGQGDVAGVGDVQGAAAQLPGQPGVDRPEQGGFPRLRVGACSSSQANLVADSAGENRRPSACSSRQVPAVRRSCHPRPGPSGTPGAGVPGDGRRPLGGDAEGLDRAGVGQGFAGDLDGGRGHGGGVELDQAGHGHVRRQGPAMDVRRWWRRVPRWRPGRCWCPRRSPGC